MDRIFSTRIDDKFIRQINEIAKRLNTSKKNIIEKAIEMFGNKIQEENKISVFKATCGAWNRDQSSQQTLDEARAVFEKSMHRNKR